MAAKLGLSDLILINSLPLSQANDGMLIFQYFTCKLKYSQKFNELKRLKLKTFHHHHLKLYNVHSAIYAFCDIDWR